MCHMQLENTNTCFTGLVCMEHTYLMDMTTTFTFSQPLMYISHSLLAYNFNYNVYSLAGHTDTSWILGYFLFVGGNTGFDKECQFKVSGRNLCFGCSRQFQSSNCQSHQLCLTDMMSGHRIVSIS